MNLINPVSINTASTILRYYVIGRSRKHYHILHFLLVIYTVFGKVYAEFRFCYEGHGPHKIRETSCPGGFVAFTPVNVTCMFYAKGPDVPNLIAKFEADMCDVDSLEVELDLFGETDFSGGRLFQKILFELDDEFAEASPGIEVDEEICAIDCLKEWVDPMVPEDEPMLIQKPDVSVDEKIKLEKDYVTRTREIYKTLIRDKYLFDDVMDDDPINFITDLLDIHTNKVFGFQYIIKLLAKSMRITMQQCSPFVKRTFYEQVLKGMVYFHNNNYIHSFVEIDPLGFHTIYKHLDACEKAVNTRFVMNGTQCEKMETVDTIINLDLDSPGPWKYRRQSRSFRWGVYDPIVEAAWVAVDFVHGFCFDTFYAAEDVLHFHLYIQAMEALFPLEPVQKHWMFPVPLKNDDFWNSMMETDDIKNQMRNLDACAIAAYLKKSPYQERLLRPFVQLEQIENPQYVTDDDDGNGKGWKKSVTEYWIWYEKQGSFQELSKPFGYCLDGSKEDLEAVEQDMQENRLNCQSQII